MRIVIVEDNHRLATTIADGFAEEGYTVEILDTAFAAIERAARRDFDLMVLDLGLPDRDGLEVLRELRVQRNRIPVLVLTARDAADARSAAFELGAVDYMVKPVAFVDLLTRVASLVPRTT